MKTVSIINLATKQLPPLWWSSSGDVVWKSKTSTSTNLRLNTGKSTRKASGQIRISKGKFKDTWDVDWHLFVEAGSVKGHIILNTGELLTAFGLLRQDVGSAHNHVFCDKHKAQAGVPGRFIRQEIYLNIPCPKAEHVGDPNFSLKITPYVFALVQGFMEKHL